MEEIEEMRFALKVCVSREREKIRTICSILLSLCTCVVPFIVPSQTFPHQISHTSLALPLLQVSRDEDFEKRKKKLGA